MAYHSSFNGEKDIRTVCGFGLLPIKTKQRGPAPLQRDETKPDIIDEAIEFYRANVLFRNYEVQGPADRVLLYLTLYISQCLQKIANLDKNGANGALYQLAIENFAIPGDANFALKGITTDPTSRADAGSNPTSNSIGFFFFFLFFLSLETPTHFFSPFVLFVIALLFAQFPIAFANKWT
jgi:actin related protein 2/3 complex subunit 3